MLYLKYVAEAVGLIIFIFPFWFYRGKSGMEWGRDLSDITQWAGQHKTVFMADGKAF